MDPILRAILFIIAVALFVMESFTVRGGIRAHLGWLGAAVVAAVLAADALAAT